MWIRNPSRHTKCGPKRDPLRLGNLQAHYPLLNPSFFSLINFYMQVWLGKEYAVTYCGKLWGVEGVELRLSGSCTDNGSKSSRR